MGNILLIWRREMGSYFALPIGRVLLAISALLFGLMTYCAGNDAVRQALAAPIFALTWFRPLREFVDRPFLLLVGCARLMALVFIPLMTMRLFPEERQLRTIEMLLTSPITEADIVIGKWLGAFSVYLMMIGVSLAGLAVDSRRLDPDWNTVLTTYLALAVLGGSLLALGELTSMMTCASPYGRCERCAIRIKSHALSAAGFHRRLHEPHGLRRTDK